MKVLLVSGSRADRGGLEPVHSALVRNNIQAKIGITVNDTGMPDPDLIMILGDRFEILNVALQAYLRKIPIVHLSGGDITEGSQDDSMRHAITKLASLHFPTNEDSAKRIIQMGEEPWRVKTVGYPGADNFELIDLSEAKEKAGISHFSDYFIIFIWHPNTTIETSKVLDEAIIVTRALNQFRDDILIIGPNNDVGGEEIGSHFYGWCQARIKDNLRTTYCKNLPRHVFLTLLNQCKCLVGNSSSGYYEAPSFGIPVVNIGSRQKGRIKPLTAEDCPVDADLIAHSIRTALQRKRFAPDNPYYTGNAADKIAETVAKIKEPRKLLLKKFYELKH
jgi:UDP-hydrolysing UDP-N-acetyl-D-glucosamine 2-epimerase